MRETKASFLKLQKKYIAFIKKNETTFNPFYDSNAQLKKFYLPLCQEIFKTYKLKKKTIIVGIAGAQGTGKTTVSKILNIILEEKYKLQTINISIDDFYKTFKERTQMSKTKHHLFQTRGVPGTHDLQLLRYALIKLKGKKFKSIFLPRFDKSIDDRLKKNKWKKITKKPKIIIFEGWCVAAQHQNKKRLIMPMNILEKENDKNLIWRNEVNNQLKKKYKSIFNLIDKKIYLKVPDFKYVYQWRLLQEKKLKVKSKGKKIMNNYEIKKFIMHYERVTRQMIKDCKKIFDIILNIDKKHKINGIEFY